MQDKAIEFEATRIKVAKIISKMKETKLNVAKYEEIYHKILNNCINENKSIPESITNNNTNFATDYLASSYSKAIKELELLLLELSKYEIYIKVSSFTEYLKNFIDNSNKTEEDFELYRKSLLDILNKLLYSNTLDYEVEGNIIEEIYEITYHFIKEEFKNLGYSITLNELRNNQTHLIYLDREIEKELETLNLKDPKYARLASIKNKIDSIGINSNYAEEELFMELVKNGLNHQKIHNVIDTLICTTNENIEMMEKYQEQKETKESELNDHKFNIKSIKGSIVKDIILFTISGSIIAGLIIGSIKLAKIKKFKTTDTTYSTTNGMTTETNYYNKLEGPNEGTYVIELSPYEKENKPYKRTKKTYNVSTVEDIPIEEYLELDLESLKVTFQEQIQETNSLNLDDVYEETIRYVKEIKIDKNDYQRKTSVFLLIVYLFISFLIEALLEYILYYSDVLDDSDCPILLLRAIEEFLGNYNELQENKKNKAIDIEEINKLNQKFEQLLQDNEESIRKLLLYYDMIKNNPEYSKDKQKIDNVLKRVRKKTN